MRGSAHALVREWLRAARHALLHRDLPVPADADRAWRTTQARPVDEDPGDRIDCLRHVLHLACSMVRLGRLIIRTPISPVSLNRQDSAVRPPVATSTISITSSVLTFSSSCLALMPSPSIVMQYGHETAMTSGSV